MGALETNTSLIYGIHLRESANDGSDFTNAAADYRIFFLGEDGELHVKDSAGTVTGFAGSGIAATLLDAKGDIIAASAADTAARLAVGANGTVLMAASGEATGLKYQFPPRSKISAGSSVSATAFADTDLLFPVLASTSYVFTFHIYFFTNATTVGLRLAINGPAGMTGRFGAIIPTAATGQAVNMANGQLTTLDTGIILTTAGPGASPVYAIVSGSAVIAGTGGNLVLRHASETATQTDIEAGSWGQISVV